MRNGWSEKNIQLNAIKDILNDERYKDVTGLHVVLTQYIEEQFRVAQEEDTKLKAEESEVAEEKTKLATHPCPCVWNEWGEWSDCTVTCGGGTKTKTRTVLKEATNGGPACDGEAEEQEACSTDNCRKFLVFTPYRHVAACCLARQNKNVCTRPCSDEKEK